MRLVSHGRAPDYGAPLDMNELMLVVDPGIVIPSSKPTKFDGPAQRITLNGAVITREVLEGWVSELERLRRGIRNAKTGS